MSPGALWRETPAWALAILLEELPAIEAARLQQAAQAAAWPWLKDGDRRILAGQLASLTRPAGGGPPVSLADLLAGDLDQAAEYLIGLGIEVRRVDAA